MLSFHQDYEGQKRCQVEKGAYAPAFKFNTYKRGKICMPTLMTLSNGKQIIYYNEYSYCLHATTVHAERWRCTATSLCSAYIKITHSGEFVAAFGQHSDHFKPVYRRQADGTYIKMRCRNN